MSQDFKLKVNIDGSAIRRIRESKKLTQFYVAKVVGVTTDTVSRWENNRYPSIRRDNALLLAEALEVQLEEILQQEPEPGESESKPYRSLKSVLPVLLILAVALLVYLVFIPREPQTYSFSAVRLLPSYAAPYSKIPVRVRLDVTGKVKGIILREHFPSGWKLVEAYPPASSLDNVEGMARWIIKPGERPDVISYVLQVNNAVEQSEKTPFFSGEVIINPRGSSISHAVEGDSVLLVGPYHWADTNGDHVIDDGETLQASDSVEEMEKLHLNWDLIETIWDAGHYRWSPEQNTFLPERKNPSQNGYSSQPSASD